MNFAAAAVLPLKRYAEFRGRSTRTEVMAFYVLTMAAMLAANLVVDWSGQTNARPWLEGGLAAAFALPTIALSVRRVHDTGRSGWWLLVVVPLIVAGIWEIILRPRPWTLHISLHFPWWVVAPVFLCGLAFWILLLWSDDPETNRYGPNSRCGPVGETV